MFSTFAGSALKNIKPHGIQAVMDAIADYLPSPLDVKPAIGTDPLSGQSKYFSPSPGQALSALVFKVTMESGRKLALLRIYSGRIKAGENVFNATKGQTERFARLFRLHAERREKVDEARAGEIVGATGIKFAQTGDTLCLATDKIILENIEAYTPVISLSIEPRNSEEASKLSEAMEKYLLEDPTLHLKTDEETGQVLLSGMGELHLDVVLKRLTREYKITPRAGKQQVVYQETISSQGTAHALFRRELAEVMHHGDVSLSVKPQTRGEGIKIIFEVDPDAWHETWLQAIEEGLEDGLYSGVIKGYPLQDIAVHVTALNNIAGESSPVGFRMAAAMALKKALLQAKPVLLEPLMWLDISVPDEFTGDVIGLLGAKGAKVENMIEQKSGKIIQALAPLRKFFDFSTALRSATQSRAGFIMKFHRFDVLP